MKCKNCAGDGTYSLTSWVECHNCQGGGDVIGFMTSVKNSDGWERVRTSSIALRFFDSNRRKTREYMKKLESEGSVKGERVHGGEIYWSLVNDIS